LPNDAFITNSDGVIELIMGIDNAGTPNLDKILIGGIDIGGADEYYNVEQVFIFGKTVQLGDASSDDTAVEIYGNLTATGDATVSTLYASSTKLDNDELSWNSGNNFYLQVDSASDRTLYLRNKGAGNLTMNLSGNMVVSGNMGKTITLKDTDGSDQAWIVFNEGGTDAFRLMYDGAGVSSPNNKIGFYDDIGDAWALEVNQDGDTIIHGDLTTNKGTFNTGIFVDADAPGEGRIGRSTSQHFDIYGDASGNIIKSISTPTNQKNFIFDMNQSAKSYIWRFNGSNKLWLSSTALYPASAGAMNFGTTSYEIGNFYQATNKVFSQGNNQEYEQDWNGTAEVFKVNGNVVLILEG